MKIHSLCLYPAVAVALVVCPTAKANLIVNGVDNGSWNQSATMIYNSDPTDPTTSSIGQHNLRDNGSLTVNSGALTLTNTGFGSFIGQQSTATLTVNGGSLTFNATGGSEQRLAIGNSGSGNGTVNINGGTTAFNTAGGADADRAFIVGRDGGNGFLNINGGTFSTDTERFGMGGRYGGATWINAANANGIVTFDLGGGSFTFNGLTDLSTASFNLGTTATSNLSYFNWLSGSSGTLSVNAADFATGQAFFQSLVDSGGIRLDANTTTFDNFQYSYDGGLATITAVPEPETVALMVVAGFAVLFFRRRRTVAA